MDAHNPSDLILRSPRSGRLEGWPQTRRYPHSSFVASFAPSTSASNFAHMMLGWTRRYIGLWAKPQSVPRLIADLVAANHILYDQHVVDAFGHVSVRRDKRRDRF